MTKLTVNLKNLFSKNFVPVPLIVQVLNVTDISMTDVEYYCLKISDGEYWSDYFSLASDLNYLVKNSNISKYAVISIEDYHVYSVVKNGGNEETLLVLINNCTVVNLLNEVVGNPKEIKVNRKISLKSDVVENSSNLDINKIKVLPISDLRVGLEKWKILIRVVKKTIIKKWSNTKNSGQLFSFDAIDESGSTRFVVFNEFVPKYFDDIDVDAVYMIQNGNVKLSNPQYTQSSNEFEIIVTQETTIEKCDKYLNNVAVLKLELVSLSKVLTLEKGSIVDFTGMCFRIDEIEGIIGNSLEGSLRKRSVIIFDGKDAVTLTFWNEEADSFNFEIGTILYVYHGRINEYNSQKYVSVTRNTIVRDNWLQIHEGNEKKLK